MKTFTRRLAHTGILFATLAAIPAYAGFIEADVTGYERPAQNLTIGALEYQDIALAVPRAPQGVSLAALRVTR